MHTCDRQEVSRCENLIQFKFKDSLFLKHFSFKQMKERTDGRIGKNWHSNKATNKLWFDTQNNVNKFISQQIELIELKLNNTV
jgi:hypothetical protein